MGTRKNGKLLPSETLRDTTSKRLLRRLYGKATNRCEKCSHLDRINLVNIKDLLYGQKPSRTFLCETQRGKSRVDKIYEPLECPLAEDGNALFASHNRSLENTYICFLVMWPPQHRNGNSNPVRFGMNTTA